MGLFTASEIDRELVPKSGGIKFFTGACCWTEGELSENQNHNRIKRGNKELFLIVGHFFYW